MTAVDTPRSVPRTPESPTVNTDEDTLAAIEDFLARTSEFQWDESARSPINAPPSDSQTAARFERTATTAGPFDPSATTPAPLASPGGSLPGSDRFGQPARDGAALANAHMTLPTVAARIPKPVLPTLLSVSAREAMPVPVTGSKTAPPARTTNVPIDVEQRREVFSIDDWLHELEAESGNGRSFAAEWQLRLTQLALGRSEAAHGLSSTLSPEARTLVTALFGAIEAVRDVARDPLLMGDTALARVNALRHALADRTEPVVSTVALCRRVVTFGVYDEMVDTEFVAGRSIQTIVYSEIENFRSDPTDDAHFETRLATRIEVFSVDGESMWWKEEPEIVDRCRRRRTDFFLAQRVTLPPTLPAGDYVLKVYVEDRLSGRAAETAYPFTIHAPISIAQRR